ncbi:unnamed protein product [Lathyrus sativus]|nr:unnamed protein product [Lathyrus sativus]
MSTQQFLTLFLFLVISSNTITSTSSLENEENTFDFVRPIDKKLLGLSKKEKLNHFKFYWHNIATGKNATSIEVVPSPKMINSTTYFGSISMMDSPLTIRPELSSKLVGKAEGFYASASQVELGLLMAMNCALIEGKYNGSSITILGRNPVFDKVKEMPVVGGTGVFKFARGYAQVTTHSLDFKTGLAIDEYNVYVFHY